MFLAVQFPLADARRFVDAPTGRLSAPPWPLADPTKHFIRGVGPVRHRRAGLTSDWLGEDLLCDAKGAVKYAPEPHGPLKGRDGRSSFRPAFRRYFAGGDVPWAGTVARLDVGLYVGGVDPGPRGIELKHFVRVALGALSLPVLVPGVRRAPLELSAAGPSIADRIRNVTTSLAEPPPASEKWWLTPGAPLVFIEDVYDRSRHLSLDNLERVWVSPERDGDPIAVHYFYTIKKANFRIPLWVVLRDPDAKPAEIRNLRVHLWRLHNEREVLGKILAHCVEEKIDPAKSGALRDYLAKQSKRLNSRRSEGFPQRDLLRCAYQLDDLVHGSDIHKLKSILDGISPGISASVMPVAQMLGSDQKIDGGAPPNFVINTPAVFNTQAVVYTQGGQMVQDNRQDFDKVKDVGAVIGGGSIVSGGAFQGSGVQSVSQGGEPLDLPALAAELSTLRAAMRAQATEVEHDRAVVSVGEAESAAVEGDQEKTLNALRKAGKWSYTVAMAIGTTLAAGALKTALGI